MRYVLTFILLLCFLAALPPGHSADAATGQGKPASQSPLQRLIADFNALEKDAAKGGRRDLWLELEERFAALQAKSKGDTEAAAAYYYARSRQELGRRSFVSADHREAAKRFGAVADKYGNYNVATDSLLRQASILDDRLSERDAAVRVLERLIRSYPKSRAAAEGKALLAKLQSTPSAASSQKTDATASSTQKPGPRADTNTAKAGKAEKPSSVTLKKITWKGKPQRAVITLELDAGAEFAHAFLPPDPGKKTPGRLYLDIEGAFPAEAVKAGMNPKNLVVSRIRTSRSGTGTRVTLDCDGLLCYAVSTPSGSPRTIHIEVSRKEDIKNGIMVNRAEKPASSQKPATVMEQLGLTVQTILLDAGHGGKDPGAMAGGIVEKQFTLAMAKRVGQLLKDKGFTVLYTRTGNQFISLADRPDIANNKKADLFISLHVNANTNPAIHGLETYYLDEAKTQDAALVAARENGVSVKNISDLQFILTDLMLSSKVKESHHLADCVQRGILQSLRGARLTAFDNGVRSAPFYVLVGARMPAILVEFGYITNTGDLQNLKSDRYLQRQAEGLVEGILRYKAELARAVPR